MADSAPLRVLVLSQHYWPESFRINSFVEELRSAGAHVEVLTGQPNYPEGRVFPGHRWNASGTQMHPTGYGIHRVPLIPRGKASHIRLALNYLSFIATGIFFGGRLLRGRKFDAIFVYGTSPILQGFVATALRRRLGGKVVLWVQDLWPYALLGTGYVKSGMLLRAVEWVVGLLYRRCDLILTQSHGFAPIVRQQSGDVPVEFFPNPGEALPALPAGGEGDDFEVVFAGNLGRAQALETIVEAAALLRDRADIVITLYGSGAMGDWIAAQIAERGLTNLNLAGRRPPEDMPAIFARASAALLTLVDDEMVGRTLPSKLQSYMATGVPVIAAAGSEAERVVREAGVGVTCPAEDARALADAILRLHAMPRAERDAMRAAGRRYHAEHFDPPTLARALIERMTALARGAREKGLT